tara:strand:+ start:536 stop:1228 length:693 start_codon:yes stop_codon:yes gene_type:complete
MKKILVLLVIFVSVGCQQKEVKEIVSNTTYSKGINPNQFKSKIDKEFARAWEKEFGSGGTSRLNWIAKNEPIVKARLFCKKQYNNQTRYDGLIYKYADLRDLSDEEFFALSSSARRDLTFDIPNHCPEAVNYFPNCRHVDTSIQFETALNAAKEVNAFFKKEGLRPDDYQICSKGMEKFFAKKKIVISDCDLELGPHLNKEGEIGVMHNEFCYEPFQDRDISMYIPTIQK